MRVLIAEDSSTLRQMLAMQLSTWDFEVVEACDGEDAWRKYVDDPFSLVLTDWIMPNADGLELIRRIRAVETTHHVYIVLLTAKSEKADLVHAMEVGADDFLVKPCDDDELRVRLNQGMRILHLQESLAQRNQSLIDAQAALVQTEKLAGVGQLAAGMAHEINNPAAIVANNLSVLQRDLAGLTETLACYRGAQKYLPEEIQQRLQDLERRHDLDDVLEDIPSTIESSRNALRRVCEVVENLRDFARLDAAQYADVRLDEAIESTVSMIRHRIDSHDLHIHCELQPNVSVVGHQAKINQLLHNVLENAIQASSPGDRIEVTLTGDEKSADVEIRDEGEGIAEENLGKVFEPFFTTRPVGQGSGLGLPFCYGVMQDHGGSIDLDSEIGKGTRVRLHFPRGASHNRRAPFVPNSPRREPDGLSV